MGTLSDYIDRQMITHFIIGYKMLFFTLAIVLEIAMNGCFLPTNDREREE